MFKLGIIDYSGISNGLLNNLTSYYKCDTNGSFPDAHGSNTGTINGATYIASGKINGGYSYTTNDYVNLGAANMISATGYTLNAWIKLDNYTNNNGIINKDSETATTDRVFQFRTDATTGVVRFIRFDSTQAVASNFASTGAISTGVWTMVTAVFDNTVGSKIYINGSEDGSDAVTTNNYTGALKATLIGARNISSLTDYMEGDIDEIGIWAGALSPTQITTLYNSNSGLSYDSFTS